MSNVKPRSSHINCVKSAGKPYVSYKRQTISPGKICISERLTFQKEKKFLPGNDFVSPNDDIVLLSKR